MRHLFHHQGLQFICDSEVPFTHVVIGQRDQAAAKSNLAEIKGKTHADLTPEEHAAVAKFAFDSTHGWYATKPLAWAESEADADALKAQFESAGWINIRVQEIDPQQVIRYA